LTEGKGGPGGRTIYLVQRRGWYGDASDLIVRAGVPVGPGVPVRAFTDEAQAEACRRELVRAAIREVDPAPILPLLGPVGPAEWTSLSPEEFEVELRKLGIEDDFWTFLFGRDWWDQDGGLTEAQREGVWQLFDCLPFYEVVQVVLKE
jgi:hypothetical protein